MLTAALAVLCALLVLVLLVQRPAIWPVLVVLVVPNVLNLAVYGWGRDAAYLRSYAGKLAAKLKRKGKAE